MRQITKRGQRSRRSRARGVGRRRWDLPGVPGGDRFRGEELVNRERLPRRTIQVEVADDRRAFQSADQGGLVDREAPINQAIRPLLGRDVRREEDGGAGMFGSVGAASSRSR